MLEKYNITPIAWAIDPITNQKIEKDNNLIKNFSL